MGALNSLKEGSYRFLMENLLNKLRKINAYLSTPSKVYSIWIKTLTIATFIVIPLLTIETPGGEQKILIYFSILVGVASYGFLILSILTSFFFIRWFKKYWYINMIIFTCSGYLILSNLSIKRDPKEIYDTGQEVEYIKNQELIIKKEYFLNTEKIRSINYFLNGKKDSIWTVFDVKGRIVESKLYKNDILIKVLKQ